MKLKKMILSIATVVLFHSNSSLAKNAASCLSDGGSDDSVIETLITTTKVVTSSSTLLMCVIFGAEVNQVMLEKEAAMVLEEDKMFVPSFLGRYAANNNMDLYEAAQDILINKKK